MLTDLWLGYTDQICKIAKITSHEVRNLLRDYGPEDCDSTTTIHTVGQWWKVEGMIELRTQLRLQGCKFVHHHVTVAGAWSSETSKFLHSLCEGVLLRTAYLRLSHCWRGLDGLSFAALQCQPSLLALPASEQHPLTHCQIAFQSGSSGLYSTELSALQCVDSSDLCHLRNLPRMLSGDDCPHTPAE